MFQGSRPPPPPIALLSPPSPLWDVNLDPPPTPPVGCDMWFILIPPAPLWDVSCGYLIQHMKSNASELGAR